METIICTLGLWLFNPSINSRVLEQVQVKCYVLDRPDPVGTPDDPQQFLLVNCLEDVRWLRPLFLTDFELINEVDCE